MKRNYCRKVCVQSFNERRAVKPVTSLSNIILTSRNFFKEADDCFIWCNFIFNYFTLRKVLSNLSCALVYPCALQTVRIYCKIHAHWRELKNLWGRECHFLGRVLHLFVRVCCPANSWNLSRTFLKNLVSRRKGLNVQLSLLSAHFFFVLHSHPISEQSNKQTNKKDNNNIVYPISGESDSKNAILGYP